MIPPFNWTSWLSTNSCELFWLFCCLSITTITTMVGFMPKILIEKTKLWNFISLKAMTIESSISWYKCVAEILIRWFIFWLKLWRVWNCENKFLENIFDYDTSEESIGSKTVSQWTQEHFRKIQNAKSHENPLALLASRKALWSRVEKNITQVYYVAHKDAFKERCFVINAHGTTERNFDR